MSPFVRWINEHSPLEAAILFVMQFDRRHHLIERLRLPNPAEIDRVHWLDRQYYQRPRLTALPRIAWDLSDPAKVCATLAQLQPAGKRRDIFLLQPADTMNSSRFGKPVYRGWKPVFCSERTICPGPAIYQVSCGERLSSGPGTQRD